MLYENRFKNPEDVPVILEKIRQLAGQTGPVRLMEVCGTHTMAIARSGLKTILPESVAASLRPRLPGVRHPCRRHRYDS